MNRDEILAILREFKRDCGEKYGILEIGLFGSVAGSGRRAKRRGHLHQDSNPRPLCAGTYQGRH